LYLHGNIAMTLKSNMFKQTLIASALVLSTFGAFAQAPATPAPAVAPVATAAVAAPAAKAPATDMAKEKLEARKAKHAAAKAKREEMKTKHIAKKGATVDAVKPIKAEVLPKQ
jgi:hypothetical protein